MTFTTFVLFLLFVMIIIMVILLFELSRIRQHLETIATKPEVDITDAVEDALYNHFVEHRYTERIEKEKA